jgi:hypothetical protein
MVRDRFQQPSTLSSFYDALALDKEHSLNTRVDEKMRRRTGSARVVVLSSLEACHPRSGAIARQRANMIEDGGASLFSLDLVLSGSIFARSPYAWRLQRAFLHYQILPRFPPLVE